MATLEEPTRVRKLLSLFHDVIHGRRTINTPANARLFLEAVPCKNPPRVCVELLVSSPSGMEAIGNSVRADINLKFITTHTLPLLNYFSDPEVKLLADGQFLLQVLIAVVHPPTVWNALVGLFLNHQLSEDSLRPFAWLVHEVVLFPAKLEIDLLNDVQAVIKNGRLLETASQETREFGYKIQKAVQLRSVPAALAASAESPGGRHDNDFADFRRIDIFPTSDEFLSTTKPFYRLVNEAFDSEPAERAGVHLDNQFRLLREDMLAELREDLQSATGKGKGKLSAHRLGKLVPVNLDPGDEARAKRCSLSLKCFSGLESLKKMEPSARERFLDGNKNFLKHQAFGALCRGPVIYGFAFVDRNIASLVRSPPVVQLQFTDSRALEKSLVALKSFEDLQFVVVGTPVFAYQPVLEGIKDISNLPLEERLLDPTSKDFEFEFSPKLQALVSKLRAVEFSDDKIIRIGSTTTMDHSQCSSFLNALSTPVSIIQGPPGTGKSFIGSQIMKYLFKYTDQKFMVISYTNHALDQFLEELQDVGIPDEAMVRLGSKHTTRTAPLLLTNQKGRHRPSQSSWAVINELKTERRLIQGALAQAWDNYQQFQISFSGVMEYLEFSEDFERFHETFTLPAESTQWKRVGRRGREIGPDYLYSRWIKGLDAGILGERVTDTTIWTIAPAERQNLQSKWTKAMISERAESVQIIVQRLDRNQERLSELFNEHKVQVLNSKRVIACTTTAAAMYNKLIRAAKPDMVLVEEAGEILECHILTALAPTVKQLVLIGDHKQLRPKINNYELSLFERLILQGHPHTTLRKQHRMHPTISAFPRALTYPDLLDDPKTADRPSIDGIRNRVIFVHHENLEVGVDELVDRRDPSVVSSKQNVFEADMVLKVVAYLGQQGYTTDRIALLTPYLGQLRLLRDKLVEENNPILNDLDAHDLIRAGLMTQAASKVDKQPLRLSTIDNYQGEESDIIVASLTRSNSSGDIGFMSAPERLNVLLSRARCCIIMIGNMNTFMSARRGKDAWIPFFNLLKEGGHLYDGLPVHCVRHPEREAILQMPLDFEQHCPDGGCFEPCGAKLSCGVHECPLRCHRIADHSQRKCTAVIERTCERNHKLRTRCSQKDERCRECRREDQEKERQRKRDLELESKRLARQEAYIQELVQIEDEIDHQRRQIQYMKEEEDEKKDMAQKRRDATELRATAARLQKAKLRISKENCGMQASDPAGLELKTHRSRLDPLDSAEEDWKWLKEQSGATSQALDDLMGMVGLNVVKQEFLAIKTKVDTMLRQNASLASERFNCVMLGNPGTGKTTVARLYSQFLCSIGVIPGQCFKETTGSALAHGGVSECKKLIDELQNDGGGVLFVDEAYQLTSGNSGGGGAVLDYLLPEVENLVGKVVFVLAGYNKEMESVFAHNPGLPSRFPIEMKFTDYTDEELLDIFELSLHKKYSGRMKCEDGIEGLYCRIVSRRIGRGRGKAGFGNARAVQNALAQVTRRQSGRLFREQRVGNHPDDFLLTKEDLIGPEPSSALEKSKPWQKLKAMIGLDSVKTAVAALVDSIQQNYVRELEEQPPIEYSLNKVLLGSPGTGKTTVAKLYGGILVDLGLLSRGEVVVKNPSDFVGAILGGSEKQTKGILAASLGKVLVIDEAYGLHSGGDHGSTSDPFKTTVVDTLVAEVQSVPGDDRCVLLLGYKDQMEKMFQNANPGLSRRFPLASAFIFDDFNDAELRKILDLKLKAQGFDATDQAKNVAMEMLDRARNRPNFGNAGEIDILLDASKGRHQSRFSRGETKSASTLEALDFDKDFDRAERSETNTKKLFEGTVGCEDIVRRLEGYQETVRVTRSLGLNMKEGIPFNFLFRGPPGTGKTTTAKKMGKVFYDMGFLASADVVECSATDLIGQYVGQTGPKVKQLLDKSLGRVLFVDEAYRLAGGAFAQEAVDELTDSTTKPQYAKKVVIILAGYENDINRLMSTNPGLTSRFSEVVDFRNLTPPECVALLVQFFKKQKAILLKKSAAVVLDISSLEMPSDEFREKMEHCFSDLTKQANWASARDVQTVAKNVFNTTLRSQKSAAKIQLVVSEVSVEAELNSMIKEREGRSQFADPSPLASDLLTESASFSNVQPNASAVSTTNQAEDTDPKLLPPESHAPAEKIKELVRHDREVQRDAGVSDEVWEQLQKDKQAEKEREEEYQKLQKAKRTATAEAREKILKRLRKEEQRREKEKEMLRKLETMGLCPMGYHWIKQSGGYRCAGGSHFVGDEQVGGW
ncbi:P-loop containing nucleoside triphosphate hydrolase protein [Eremomyces bilateralis CBS 781.70]|uniref:P-loop containing nucleoside triphosphate hydrolase protein n=1 Tax=Eremomyces bilateralis CBS 781.70 TaxID=1392243 RepID=A0A6G1G7X2_9PEZI|nr:P-loop containing nucleoside triphosphate hydrolase protein [Eremomyces bilateralis CBS 781.70]KAF1814036.1 P-loop containing nucleoside triphosphate hydrolase protein [Eremomyces bilateralis CBS 781.70]